MQRSSLESRHLSGAARAERVLTLGRGLGQRVCSVAAQMNRLLKCSIQAGLTGEKGQGFEEEGEPAPTDTLP